MKLESLTFPPTFLQRPGMTFFRFNGEQDWTHAAKSFVRKACRMFPESDCYTICVISHSRQRDCDMLRRKRARKREDMRWTEYALNLA